jgi:hypothetical protein
MATRCTCSPPIIDPVCPVEEHRISAGASAFVVGLNPDIDGEAAKRIARLIEETTGVHSVFPLDAAKAGRIFRIATPDDYADEPHAESGDRVAFVNVMMVLCARYQAELEESYFDACWEVLAGAAAKGAWFLTAVLAGDALRALTSMPTVEDWRRLLAERGLSPGAHIEHAAAWTSSPTYAVKHRVEIGDRVGYVYEYPNGKAWARLENPDEKLGSFTDVESARQAVLKAACSP